MGWTSINKKATCNLLDVLPYNEEEDGKDSVIGNWIRWAASVRLGPGYSRMLRGEKKMEGASHCIFLKLSSICIGEHTEKDRMEVKQRWRDMKENRETRPAFFKPYFVKLVCPKY
jgi:hypothetical protein